MGGEIGQRHIGAAVIGGGVVDGERVGIARQDKDDLPSGHFGQRGQGAQRGIVVKRDGIARAAEGGGEVI